MHFAVESRRKTYSSGYGDLGATAAAILQTLRRDRLVKIIHAIRAMECSDAHDGPTVFKQLQDVGEQFSVFALSVLYFGIRAAHTGCV